MNTTTVEQHEKTVIASPGVKNKSVRRSRRSVAFVDIEEKVETTSSETTIAEKPRRSTRNRSAASLNSESDSKENIEEKKVSPMKRRRSLRLATTTSVGSDNETVEELPTPKEGKKSRKSVDPGNKTTSDTCKDLSMPSKENTSSIETPTASVASKNDISEETSSTKGKRKSRKSGVHEKRVSSDSCVDLNQPSKENTPSNKKKQKSRNKSFGGFR